jgi:hypothetical protein
VLEVARFEDYRAVAERLQGGAGAGGVALDADVFGVLIGCSGHSPVPAHLVDKVAGVLHREVVLRRGVTAIWGGGDPCFRFQTSGGNVADIARTLLRLHHHHHQGHVATSSSSAADARSGLLIGAVQRDDYAGKVPAFEEVVVAYHASLAQVGGRPTFGGFETAAVAVPPAYRDRWWGGMRGGAGVLLLGEVLDEELRVGHLLEGDGASRGDHHQHELPCAAERGIRSRRQPDRQTKSNARREEGSVRAPRRAGRRLR